MQQKEYGNGGENNAGWNKSLREGSDKQNVPGKKCRAGTENRNMYIDRVVL